MAVRTSMNALIASIRTFIGDAAGADAVFTDDQIQEALDARRRRVSTQELSPETLYAPGGSSLYITYYAESGFWEDSPLLQDRSYAPITGVSTPISLVTSDPITGTWTFSGSIAPPVYISGRQYDVYGTAADVLDSWLALAQTEFDFLELGSTFKRGQQSPAIEQTIKRYRRKQWLRTTPIIRDDELPGWYA